MKSLRIATIALSILVLGLFAFPQHTVAAGIEWTKETEKVLKTKHRMKLGDSLTLQLISKNDKASIGITCPPGGAAYCKGVKTSFTKNRATFIFDSNNAQMMQDIIVGKDSVTSMRFRVTEIVAGFPPKMVSSSITFKIGVDPNPCFKFKTSKQCTLAKDCQWNGQICKDVKGEKKPESGAKRGFTEKEASLAAQKAEQERVTNLAKGTFSKLGNRTPQTIFGGIIKAILSIAGSIALAMFVYGGIMIMMAGGNAERTKQGTQILVWSALGVIVILSSYALVDLVFDVFR